MPSFGELIGNDTKGDEKKCEKCGRMFVPKLSHFTDCPECHKNYRSKHDPRSRESRGDHENLFQEYRQYLKGGYFDEKGCLRLKLVADWPDKLANEFNRTGGVTSTGLRRFYTMVKWIEQKLTTGEDFDSLKAELVELKFHAANAVGKATQARDKKGWELFKKFIDWNVELACQNEESFKKGFLIHFQGLIAYFKYHEKK